jgi:uncharacterized protein
MSVSRPPRAVVDTNVLVSTLIRPGPTLRQLLEAWDSRRFQLVTSRYLRDELEEVLLRPKIAARFGVTPDRITAILGLLDLRAQVVTVTSQSETAVEVALVADVRDAHDRPVIAAALVSRADYLVTGDQDLLSLRGDERLGTLRIATPREFLDELAGMD